MTGPRVIPPEEYNAGYLRTQHEQIDALRSESALYASLVQPGGAPVQQPTSPFDGNGVARGSSGDFGGPDLVSLAVSIGVSNAAKMPPAALAKVVQAKERATAATQAPDPGFLDYIAGIQNPTMSIGLALGAVGEVTGFVQRKAAWVAEQAIAADKKAFGKVPEWDKSIMGWVAGTERATKWIESTRDAVKQTLPERDQQVFDATYKAGEFAGMMYGGHVAMKGLQVAGKLPVISRAIEIGGAYIKSPIARAAIGGAAGNAAYDIGEDRTSGEKVFNAAAGAVFGGALAKFFPPALAEVDAIARKLRNNFAGPLDTPPVAATPDVPVNLPRNMAELPPEVQAKVTAMSTRMQASRVAQNNEVAAMIGDEKHLTSTGAGLQAVADSKFNTLVHSPLLPEHGAASVVTDLDVAAAHAVQNPGGGSVVQGVNPRTMLDQIANTTDRPPHFAFVQRGQRVDMLTSSAPIKPQNLVQYKKFGHHDGMRVQAQTGDGAFEGVVVRSGARGVTVRNSASNQTSVVPASKITVMGESLSVTEAPAMYSQFRVGVEQLEQAAARAVPGYTPRDWLHPETTKRLADKMENYFDSKKLGEGDRNVLRDYFNRSRVEDFAEHEAVRESVGIRNTIAKQYDGAQMQTADIDDLHEVVSSKGFRWIPNEGRPGGKLHDTAMGTPPKPFLDENAAMVYAKSVQRELPGLDFDAAAPAELAGMLPTVSNVNPVVATDTHMSSLAATMGRIDNDVLQAADSPTLNVLGGGVRVAPPTMDELAVVPRPPGVVTGGTPQLAGTGGTTIVASPQIASPAAGAGGMLPGALPPMTASELGTARGQGMVATAVAEARALQRVSEFGQNYMRYTEGISKSFAPMRRFTAEITDQVQRALTKINGSEAAENSPLNLWRTYDNMTAATTRMHYEAQPMLNSYDEIIKQFRPSTLRNAKIVETYEIADDAMRLAEARKLGMEDKEIAAFEKLNGFFKQAFGESGIDPVREIKQYLPRVRAMQAADEEIDDAFMGNLSEAARPFFEHVRRGGLEVRNMDLAQLGPIYTRAMMFEKHVAPAYNEAVALWKGVHAEAKSGGMAELQNIAEHMVGRRNIPGQQDIPGWLDVVRHGYDPRGDMVVKWVQQGLKPFVGNMSEAESMRFIGASSGVQYKAMLGFRPDLIVRDMTQMYLTMPFTGTSIFKSLTKWHRGNAGVKQEMLDAMARHGVLEPGMINSGAGDLLDRSVTNGPALEATSHPGRRAVTAIGNAVGDVTHPVTSRLPNWVKEPTFFYGQRGERNRMMAGYSGYSTAQEALRKYAAGAPWDDKVLLGRAGMGLHAAPIKREFLRLVQGGETEAAAGLAARSLANATQFRYGVTEAAPNMRSVGGRMAMQLGNFSTQMYGLMKDATKAGADYPIETAMFWGFLGSSTYALAYADKATGFNTSRWQYLTGVAFTGSPVLKTAVDVAAAGSRLGSVVGSAAEGQDMRYTDQNALTNGGEAIGALAQSYNPVRGLGTLAQNAGLAADAGGYMPWMRMLATGNPSAAVDTELAMNSRTDAITGMPVNDPMQDPSVRAIMANIQSIPASQRSKALASAVAASQARARSYVGATQPSHPGSGASQ